MPSSQLRSSAVISSFDSMLMSPPMKKSSAPIFLPSFMMRLTASHRGAYQNGSHSQHQSQFSRLTLIVQKTPCPDCARGLCPNLPASHVFKAGLEQLTINTWRQHFDSFFVNRPDQGDGPSPKDVCSSSPPAMTRSSWATRLKFASHLTSTARTSAHTSVLTNNCPMCSAFQLLPFSFGTAFLRNCLCIMSSGEPCANCTSACSCYYCCCQCCYCNCTCCQLPPAVVNCCCCCGCCRHQLMLLLPTAASGSCELLQTQILDAPLRYPLLAPRQIDGTSCAETLFPSGTTRCVPGFVDLLTRSTSVSISGLPTLQAHEIIDLYQHTNQKDDLGGEKAGELPIHR